MKKLILLPFLFIALTSLGQTKLTIQKTGVIYATVQNDLPDYAYGDEGLWAYSVPRNQTGAYDLVHSFFQFDLSSIPAGSKVNWARLSLFKAYGSNSGSNTALLRRVTSAWDPATVTWNTQPAVAKRSTVRLPYNPNALKIIKILM